MYKYNQTRNIIKAVGTVLLSVAVGEGVLGLGLFWPFLLILLDWSGVYWLSLAVGILISSLYRLPIGYPALFMVAVVGGLSLLLGKGKEAGWIILAISLLANAVFDKVFGLGWSLWEAGSIVVVWIVATKWQEGSETIKINY